jgi:hypothetical protein
MRVGIAKNFQEFSSINENGALMGPWNPWLRRNLIYLVGLYCLVSVTLNGFDVPVPEPNATEGSHLSDQECPAAFKVFAVSA